MALSRGVRIWFDMMALSPHGPRGGAVGVGVGSEGRELGLGGGGTDRRAGPAWRRGTTATPPDWAPLGPRGGAVGVGVGSGGREWGLGGGVTDRRAGPAWRRGTTATPPDSAPLGPHGPGPHRPAESPWCRATAPLTTRQPGQRDLRWPI